MRFCRRLGVQALWAAALLAGCAALSGRAVLAGNWQSFMGDAGSTWVLREDGTFTVDVLFGGGRSQLNGTYVVSPGIVQMTVRQVEGPGSDPFSAVLRDPSTARGLPIVVTTNRQAKLTTPRGETIVLSRIGR